jgi:hypothetical protein
MLAELLIGEAIPFHLAGVGEAGQAIPLPSGDGRPVVEF